MRTTQINYLNIGLMIVSATAAYVVPFHLFLFSYAVLGPLHYLTEINWLHKRRYFTSGKYDYVLFIGVGVLLFMAGFPLREVFGNWGTAFVFIAFTGALAFVLFKKAMPRVLSFMFIIFGAFIIQQEQYHFSTVFFSVMLPTIIHVFLFTGAFILFGALKGNSNSGYFSGVVFLACALSFFVFVPEGGPWFNENYVLKAYKDFAIVNVELSRVLPVPVLQSTVESIYFSTTGLMIMRFIAFAYTYHYLNWFSKTSIIKWHAVKQKTLFITLGLWVVSIGWYLYDYHSGLIALYFLSFLHVLMEFPLNYRSFIGIGQELGVRWFGLKTAVAKR